MSNRTCTIAGCDRPHKGRGFCDMHIQRWRRHGDAEQVDPSHWRHATLEERFWARVDRSISDACWPWRGRDPHPFGYGRMWVAGQRLYTHRMAWELAHGPIPTGMSVLHHCDNPPCCNPTHLFLGTQADNIADMWAKGRGSLPPWRKAKA